jgi:D-3-phosphoglycerate dehydrogenase
MKPLIVVGGGLHPEGLRLMEQEARVAIVSDSLSEAGMITEAKEAAGILFRSKPLCSRSLMSALPNLKVIGRHGVGLDIVDLPAATELGIPVVHAPGSNSNSVAEHAIGVGNIGRRVAKTAGAMGMRVIGYDKYVAADDLRRHGVEPLPDLASVLRQADVVTCHTPHTRETHHMIDAAAVSQMKDGVIFINTSRGKTQDENALLAGLESGKIRAAGLDVFEEEPASSDNRLLQLENVIVSPHIAGVTRESMKGMAIQVSEEMLRVLRGERPRVLGNPDLWPRLGHLK